MQFNAFEVGPPPTLRILSKQVPNDSVCLVGIYLYL